MWDSIFSVALSNGIFAALFVALFIYQLKDSKHRESKYQDTIKTLSNCLTTVNTIKDDVEEIKKIVVYKREEK